MCSISPRKQHGTKQLEGSNSCSGASLLHGLIAGAAGREDRDGAEIAGSYAALLMSMVPPRSRLLHPGSPEDFLDLPVILLQHLVNVA